MPTSSSFYDLISLSDIALLRLDDLASRVSLPPERYVMRTVKELNRFFFEEEGFRGAEDYYRPGNSCINEASLNLRGGGKLLWKS